MNIKCFFLTILVYILFISISFSEVLISINSGIVLELQDIQTYSPDIGISGSFDSYKPVNEFWSLFLYGDGELNYLPKDDKWLFELGLEGDVSFRKNRRLIRFSLYSDYLGTSVSSLDYMGLTPEIYFSMDLGNCSLFTTHSLTIDFAAKDYLAYDGDIGISLMASPNFILDPHIAGGVIKNGTENEYYQDTTLEYSWYPGIPFVLDGEFGFKQIFSTAPFYELYFNNELTISLGSPAQLVITLPSTLQFYRDLSEIASISQPEIALDFSLFKNAMIVFSSGSQIEYRFISKDFYSSLFFSLNLIFSL